MIKRILGKQSAIVWLVCATTAIAGGEQPAPNRAQKENSKTRVVWVRRSCYVLLSGSPFPQPCDRLAGGTPSTAIPMNVIGEPPPKIIRTQIVARDKN
jgi:hypothetical protein